MQTALLGKSVNANKEKEEDADGTCPGEIYPE
jgi:hypothetical protein